MYPMNAPAAAIKSQYSLFWDFVSDAYFALLIPGPAMIEPFYFALKFFNSKP